MSLNTKIEKSETDIQKLRIILKKGDKGITTVVMNRENKIREGEKRLDDRNNNQPLDKPMVRHPGELNTSLMPFAKRNDCLTKRQIRLEFQCFIPSQKFTNRH